MKSLTYIAVFLLLISFSLSAQTTEWKVDKSHSKISFEVSHMVISSVTGFFKDYNIEFNSNKDDFTGSDINFTAEVASIDTDNEKRDEHLKSPDFFDVANYPQIKFVGKSFTKVDDKNYKLVGDFTLRGVTKEIILNVEYKGTVNDPWGGTRAGFKLTGQIDRMEYGLEWNKVVESGGFVVGHEVEIICVIELQKG